MTWGNAMTKVDKIHWRDPEIIKHFKEHLAEGWSAISFGGRLTGGHSALRKLCTQNLEFREIWKKVVEECGRPEGFQEHYSKFLHKKSLNREN